MSLDIYLKNGQYKLEKILGQGGMARVYLGLDTQNNRRVAIKQTLIDPGSPHTQRLVKRFKREYHFLSSIHHRNVIKAYDFLEERGQYFMVMEYVPGISLQELIVEKRHQLTLQQQLAIAIQVVRGVEVLNAAGVLHRDLKPENIMVNQKNKLIKILDLGLGVMLDNEATRLTKAGTTVGTPEYMSPEQIMGEFSATSDIFSLGIALYQFFLWKETSPFKSDNMVKTMELVSQKRLPSLIRRIKRPMTDLEQTVYEQISALLAKAMEKSPGNRIANAGILADELDRMYQIWQTSQMQTVIDTSFLEEKDTHEEDDLWRPTVRLGGDQLAFLQRLGEKYGKDDIFDQPLPTPTPVAKVNKSTRRNTLRPRSGQTGKIVKQTEKPTHNYVLHAVIVAILVVIVAAYSFLGTKNKTPEQSTNQQPSNYKNNAFQNAEWLQEKWPSWLLAQGEKQKLEEAFDTLAQYYQQDYKSQELKQLLDGLAEEYKHSYRIVDAFRLAHFLFKEKELQVNNQNFYDPKNSDLVHVIKTKQGIPISLISVYILVGHRLGLEIEGCPYPRNFLARVLWENQVFFVDCLKQGEFLTKQDIINTAQLDNKEQQILEKISSSQDIIERTLRNLVNVYTKNGDKKNEDLVKNLLEKIQSR